MASTYLSLTVHAIFATKSRAPMIAAEWRGDLHAYLAGTLNGLGAKALVVGGVADHVHVLFSLNSTHCVADLVRETKKASSAWGKNRYEGFAWQSGYAAFTIHAKAIPTVASYIARQEQHHATLSSADELRQLLAEFDVAYDPQFFE